ncbi:Galactosylgalactosylxylosylprotein 3-beta-glucuronosyltransferase 1 [Liparis tanakae]|uniref:Galactosylgalactosylxylosylprotein 3-beta-glucuronosyltransferase n=1 Tax=Liparis tanakae TaxID=230148 RepID=A0A4Z2EHD0_9TELE|nr:Galactosylgalactosylxylosylprotein 3-beta-glucuronosyltransferase 1 [Liparis tanakae]
MRSTRKVSVWPVAFVGGLRYESPKVNAAGKVYGWKTVFDPHRPFAIDMAGFAINLRLILFKPQAYFKLRGVKGGYQESSLLRELVTLNDLEPKAANCTKVIPLVYAVEPLEMVLKEADSGLSYKFKIKNLKSDLSKNTNVSSVKCSLTILNTNSHSEFNNTIA